MEKLNLDEILPHDKPMILIDEIIEINLKENYAETSVTIHDNKIFFNREINGISPIVGIEFMAQTIGCFAFYNNTQILPKIGFLLGTRLYKNSLEKFENGKTYTIKAFEVFSDDELVSFECFIYNGGIECANAIINAFQPKNAEEYLKGI